MVNQIKKYKDWFILGGVVLTIDLLTKWTFWTYPENIHHINRWRLVAGVIAVLWMSLIAFRNRLKDKVMPWLFLIYAGTLGNIIDGLDGVVNNPIFVANEKIGWYGSLNIADVSLTIGTIGILYLLIREKLRDRRELGRKEQISLP